MDGWMRSERPADCLGHHRHYHCYSLLATYDAVLPGVIPLTVVREGAHCGSPSEEHAAMILVATVATARAVVLGGHPEQ